MEKFFNTIGEELSMAYDNATHNRRIGVIVRRLANGWYDGVYKGEQRKQRGILVLQEEGIWEHLRLMK